MAGDVVEPGVGSIEGDVGSTGRRGDRRESGREEGIEDLERLAEWWS
jgi:hypothetical protein